MRRQARSRVRVGMITIDSETQAIDQRPAYPPEPVGFGIKVDDAPGVYHAWGHPTENNTTYEDARRVLASLWDTDHPLLFQNANFDLEVLCKYMDLPMPHWSRVHDTQFLLYLYNPHARSLSLKPSAEALLDWAPEEQDRLRDWVYANVRGGANKGWGAHIAKAPGGLTGEYCIGDVDRTRGLYSFLEPYIQKNGMGAAYEVERELRPILLDSERLGMRLDMPRLEQDHEVFSKAFHAADEEIREMLGAPGLNLNSGVELADAIDAAGLAGEWVLTPTGKRSTSKANLMAAVRHPRLLAMLGYRGALKTCLGTFMEPWLELGTASGGRLHTHWHQTRNPEGNGTRTGRISSSKPNLTNVPNELSEAPEGYPALPHMREYTIPDEGMVWLKRDYSSQEVRVAAHFEDGELMDRYEQNPAFDPHQFASDVIRETTGYLLPRKKVKITAFSLIYGSGIKNLSAQLDVPYPEASQTKEMYLGALPGLRKLMGDIKRRGERSLPVRTTGGRVIFSEPPLNGRSFAYKLLNHLIQGSSADITKQAMINYHNSRAHGQMLAQVYDELNIQVPIEHKDTEMALLKEAMEVVPLDVLLLTEGYEGKNWREADKD